MTDSQVIQETIDGIRRRWRIRLGLEAAVKWLVVVLAFLLVWAVAWGIAGASAPLALVGRVAAAVLLGGAGGYLAWRWLAPRPDDAQVALYLEERAPALQQSVVSAVETLRHEPLSLGLKARVLVLAREQLDRIDRGRSIERDGVRRAAGWLGGLTLGSAALLAFGPGGLRDAVVALAVPGRPIPVVAPFAISLRPGNADVPKGGAIEIAARLNGFGSEVAELLTRRDTTAEWERLPMGRDSVGQFVSRLFDLDRNTEYFVEAAGVRSPTFRLTVVDLPAVRTMAATVVYPRYTGMAAESIAEAGDLAVLTGSTVALRVTTSRPARGAVLVVEGRAPIPMVATPGGWTAGFRVSRDVFYRVDLQSEDGRTITGLNYAVDALEDRPPTVRFAAPGRDTKVTSIEEVTAQAEATDDFGITRLVLHVSANGAADSTIPLADSTVRALKELSAAHTFFLEEWHLTPGDLVSYYAEALDGAGQSTKSDIYFLEVRPFDKTYREAEQGGGQPGGGGQDSPDGLSERQRQLVVGTFNVVRDSGSKVDQFAEDVTTLAIGQGRLRTDVGSLLSRLRQRQMGSVDSTFDLIAKALDSATAHMTNAEEKLGRRQARGAVPDEQRALQHLQRAEAAYREVMVALGQQNGGGGGGGGAKRAEELADLFELETDKLRNQYESVERESGKQAERALDETLERLRRLASRQEQENERLQRAAEALRGKSSRSGSGGGGSQRQLAQEAEEEARKLERLARERGDRSLEDAARRLREASEQMRRAASASAEQGAAQGGQALDRLRNTAKELERSRIAGREDAIRQTEQRARALARQQREIGEQSSSLPTEPNQRGERINALGAKKDALAREVERLEADADRLARDAAREQPNAARKLAEAAEGIRTNRIRDKLVFSKDLLRRASPEYLRNFEEQIGANLGTAAEQLGEAVRALGQGSEANRQAKTLERTRDLVRGLESLSERARAAQEQRAGESPNPQSQQGNPGQQGQQGQGGQPSDQPNAPGGQMDNDGNRQFGREFRARRQAAESLRAELRSLGQETAEIDRLLSLFRALDNGKSLGDPRGLDRLEQDLLAGLKELEFSLWRRFGTDTEQRPALGASARVPPQYRDQVEEYYRSLARQRPPRP